MAIGPEGACVVAASKNWNCPRLGKRGDEVLVLSRREGEKIVIGEDIAIEVVEVRGNKVRIGITAPDYVTIMREELLDVLNEWEHRRQGKVQACA